MSQINEFLVNHFFYLHTSWYLEIISWCFFFIPELVSIAIHQKGIHIYYEDALNILSTFIINLKRNFDFSIHSIDKESMLNSENHIEWNIIRILSQQMMDEIQKVKEKKKEIVAWGFEGIDSRYWQNGYFFIFDSNSRIGKKMINSIEFVNGKFW